MKPGHIIGYREAVASVMLEKSWHLSFGIQWNNFYLVPYKKEIRLQLTKETVVLPRQPISSRVSSCNGQIGRFEVRICNGRKPEEGRRSQKK